MRLIFLFAALAMTTTGLCAGVDYYVDIRNDSGGDVSAFAIAAAGSEIFRSIDLHGHPLAEGASLTIITRKNQGGCLRDMRTRFSNGRESVERDFNVCTCASYHIGQQNQRCDRPATPAQP